MPIVGPKEVAEFMPGPVARPFAPRPLAVTPRPAPQPAPKPAPKPAPRPAPKPAPRPPPRHFGPKPKPAIQKLAATIKKVRTKYLGAANRRNNAAIKQGILSRTPAPAAAPAGAPAPQMQSLVLAFVALNEALLDLAAGSKDAATLDMLYRKSCQMAIAAESSEKKIKYHQHAGNRAAELGCVARAERHQRLVAALIA